MEIQIELLVGTEVRDVDGKDVGRIEEFRVRRDETSCLVDSYLIGVSALVARLGAWTLVRPISRLLKSRELYLVYEVPWQDMDLSDQEHPRLRIAKRDLRHAK